MGSTPKPPPLPDPREIARVDAEFNRIDQITPFGNLTFSGPNRNTATQTLSPELQGLFDQRIQSDSNQLSQALDRQGLLDVNPIDLSNFGDIQSGIDTSNINFGGPDFSGLPGLNQPNFQRVGQLQGSLGQFDVPQLGGQQSLNSAPNFQGSVNQFGVPQLGQQQTVGSGPDFQGSVDRVNLQGLGDQQQVSNTPSLQGSLAGQGLQGLGALQSGVNQTPLQGQIGTTNVQGQVDTGLDTSNLPGIPQDPNAFRNDVQQAFFDRGKGLLDSVFSNQQRDLEQRLANQGLPRSGEAVDRDTKRFLGARNKAFTNLANDAILASGGEASRQLGDILSARGQGFGEQVAGANLNLAGGQFANQASGQRFGQGLAQGQFANQSAGQGFGQNLAAGQFGNNSSLAQFGAGLQGAEFGLGQSLAQGNFANNASQQDFQNQLSQTGFNNQAELNQFDAGLQGAQFGLGQNLSLGNFSNQSAQNEFSNRLSGAGFNNQTQLNQFGSGLQGAQFGFNQNLAGGEFANNALQGNFNNQLSQTDFNNQIGQNQFNSGLQGAQFGFGQNLQSGQFSNNAALSGAGFDNQVGLAALGAQQGIRGQLAGERIDASQGQNQASQLQLALQQQQLQNANAGRSQALSEALGIRGNQFNELQALLGGQQVQSPQLSNFFAPGNVNTLGGFQLRQQQQQNNFNQENLNNSNFLDGLFGLGAAGLSNPAVKFSDIRLKRDISLIGELPSGLPVYSFRYKGEEGFNVGVMAQEAIEVIPDSVIEDSDGYLMVDYGRIH